MVRVNIESFYAPEITPQPANRAFLCPDVVPIRVAGVKSAARRIHWNLCSARWHVVGSKMAMIEYCESRKVGRPQRVPLMPGSNSSSIQQRLNGDHVVATSPTTAHNARLRSRSTRR